VEDLRNADSRVRLRAIKSLPSISSSIGKEKTRTELLPYLASLIEDEEEENLIELTKILSNFLELIGGKQFVLHIFKLFENMLQLDEFTLRYEVSIKVIIRSSKLSGRYLL
jgi:serine/threonine-protein phosphatase 2A regulatory subunit A